MKSQCLQPLLRIQIKIRPRGRALEQHRSNRMPTKLACVFRSAKLIAEGRPLCARSGRSDSTVGLDRDFYGALCEPSRDCSQAGNLRFEGVSWINRDHGAE